MGRLVRGLGQIQLSPTSLPPMGNLNAQIQHGTNLLQQGQDILSSGGDLNGLANMGITLAQGFSQQGAAGTVVRVLSQIGAAAAACSVGGPITAAMGAIAAAITSAIEGIFSGAVYEGAVACPSQAEQLQYKGVVQWSSQMEYIAPLSGKPQGWTFADYLANRFPPHTTKRGNDLKKALVQARVEAYHDNNPPAQNPNAGTLSQALQDVMLADAAGTSGWGGTLSTTNLLQGSVSAGAIVSSAVPLCTPVYWYWGQPDQIQDCNQATFFWPMGSPGSQYYKSNAQLKNIWDLDTSPMNGLTREQIQASALARKPDPLYWDSRLYSLYVPTNVLTTGDTYTYFMNLAALSGIATVLGLLCVGASTVTIAQELMLHQLKLKLLDGKVPFLFRMLVEDYLAMAHRELANAPTAISPGMSTAAKIALAALAAGAGGVAVYSYKHRISPVETIKLATRRL